MVGSRYTRYYSYITDVSRRPPPPPPAVSHFHTYSKVETQKQTGSDAYEKSERHAVALDTDLDRMTRLREAPDISEASHLFIYT
ncbi:uncharacterized [Tachysurus ichikawai]